MEKQPNFVSGLYWNDPHPNSPAFIKGKISIKAKEFVDYLRANYDKESGYVNVILKESKNGKYYFELDTWKPNKEQRPAETQDFGQSVDNRADEIIQSDDIRVEDIPF